METEVLIVGIIFTAFVVAIKILTDFRTRQRLIDKGEINENVKHLFKAYSSRAQSYSNLKWGLVLLGIGLAMLSKQVLPFYVSDESVFGLMFLFAGIGFFIYYAVASKHLDNNGPSQP